ncbi:MAG: diaminopimelate decarboxylase [Thiomargarita sp.]|nr:diaminopimelate decarboxylase [Thiomargarita sp.]
MDHFNYQQDILYAENVNLAELAEQYGTPCYVYSRATFEQHWYAFDQSFATGQEHLICYAVKANSNLAVLNILARLGSGFDIVSGGELERVLRAGGDPQKVVFSGVGKTVEEMRHALKAGILCFNVESEAELQRLNQIAAEMGKQAPISLRVNPDVDAKTHTYISTGLKENKFGIGIHKAVDVYLRANSLEHINIVGVDCHIGSQLTEITPFIDALKKLLVLIEALQQHQIHLQHIDIGGGLGVRYLDEKPPTPKEYVKACYSILGNTNYQLILEPGRAIAANAGILVTKVEYLKETDYKQFAIIDAAMNDLLRPTLYQTKQAILPIKPRENLTPQKYDIVGPICETGDFLAKDRLLALEAGDLLAIRSSGAYGFTMSSNYNTRPRVAELMVDGDRVTVVRKREIIDDLLALESILG